MNEKNTTTTSLLNRAREWDAEALAEIYDTYQPAILRYTYRQLGHTEAAEEVTAETFHRFLIAIKKGKGPREHLSAWLYRVAHNLVVDYFRKRSAHPEEMMHEGIDVGTPAKGDALIEQQERIAKARLAMQQLTPLQRQVIALRFMEEMSYAETARIVKRNVNAVKALQHRALNRMQRFLKASEEQEHE